MRDYTEQEKTLGAKLDVSFIPEKGTISIGVTDTETGRMISNIQSGLIKEDVIAYTSDLKPRSPDIEMIEDLIGEEFPLSVYRPDKSNVTITENIEGRGQKKDVDSSSLKTIVSKLMEEAFINEQDIYKIAEDKVDWSRKDLNIGEPGEEDIGPAAEEISKSIIDSIYDNNIIANNAIEDIYPSDALKYSTKDPEKTSNKILSEESKMEIRGLKELSVERDINQSMRI